MPDRSSRVRAWVFVWIASWAVATAGELPFAEHPVCRIELTIPPEGIRSLRENSRTYVAARLAVDGRSFQNVGVHLKGSTGSFRGLNDKPAFTIDLSRFQTNDLLHGVSKLHLNNSVEDPTFLREQIGSELFRLAGVPAPAVSHAVVQLNGRKLGLYVLKEGFAEPFLARNFTRSDGNLYDTDWEHDVDRRMKRHLGTGPDNAPELQQLTAAAREPDLAKRWILLQQAMDQDRFIKFMAVEVLIDHWDGYCLGRNNFRIYQDPETSGVVFLPTGMDQIFNNSKLNWNPRMSGLVAGAVMETAEGRLRYEATVRELLPILSNWAHTSNRVDAWYDSFRPELSASEAGRIREEVQSLKAGIHERFIHVANQLKTPGLELAQIPAKGLVVTNWQRYGETREAALEERVGKDGKRILAILAKDTTSAAWRSELLLPKGNYEFSGQIQIQGLDPLPFGRNQGVRLRLGEREGASKNLTNAPDWRRLQFEFQVVAAQEKVELICELRAKSGEARFQRDSLVLKRIE